jgi:hypothetical protein
VSSVSFEPRTSHDRFEGKYRFASVAQDTNMLLWEFSTSELTIPSLDSISASIYMIVDVPRVDTYDQVCWQPTIQLSLSLSLSLSLAVACLDCWFLQCCALEQVPILHPIAENTQAHVLPLTSVQCYRIAEGVAYATTCIGGRVNIWYPASAAKNL